MKNTKIKFMLLFCTFLIMGSTAKINAMENNNKNQYNLNKAINITTNQKQKNKSYDKKLNNLNLFSSKENKIKNIDAKLNTLNQSKNLNLVKQKENKIKSVDAKLNTLNQSENLNLFSSKENKIKNIDAKLNTLNQSKNLNLVKQKENENLKNKYFDKKINDSNLNNIEENLNIEPKLKEFDVKFSDYVKDLITLKIKFPINNFISQEDLKKIEKNYKEQKPKIEETINKYNIFLGNLTKISKDKLHQNELINKISKNITNIKSKIKTIGAKLNTLNQSKNLNNYYKINIEYKNDEEKNVVITNLLNEINSEFVNYDTIIEYLYKSIKILEYSVNENKKLFIEYNNSIINQPIEEIFKLKTKYEENSNKIKDLIKKFDEFKEILFKNLDNEIKYGAKIRKNSNILLNHIEEIKSLILKIDEIAYNFLIFDNEKEKYTYYNFLKKSNQKNYEKNKPDINIISINREFNDEYQSDLMKEYLNSTIKNNMNFNTSDIVDIPNMLEKLDLTETAKDEIKMVNEKEKNSIFDGNKVINIYKFCENNFNDEYQSDLMNKYLKSTIENNMNFNTSDIVDIPNMLEILDLKETAKDEIKMVNEKEKNSIFDGNKVINIYKFCENNFNEMFIKEFSEEIPKKYENTLKSLIDLLKNINDKNIKNKINDFIEQYINFVSYYNKKNNENFIKEDMKKNFMNTMDKSKTITKKLLMLEVIFYEAITNLNLKPIINLFFELQNKMKENIKNNEEKIISEEDWDKFKVNNNRINHKIHILKERYNRTIDDDCKELNKMQNKYIDFTLILKSIGTKPFINLLTNELNSDKKTYDSLLFQLQMQSYGVKLNILFSDCKEELINNLKSKSKLIECCNRYERSIQAFCSNFYSLLKYLKKKIKEFEDQNIEIYEKEALKEKINCFENIIVKTGHILSETSIFIETRHNYDDNIKQEIKQKIEENFKSIQDVIFNRNKNAKNK